VKIALVSRQGEALRAYTEFLAAHDAVAVHFSNISEMYQKLPEVPISGFILDIPAIVKASERERALLLTLEPIFASIRVNWNQKAGFRALFSDSTKSGEENLLGFLDRCKAAKPRSLRKDERKLKSFNLLVWGDSEREEQGRRAFTLNVSRSGMFVCTCDPHPAGTILNVKIMELDDRPFRVEVRWEQPWGVAMMIPGFGCRFDGLKGERLKLLEAALF
jgi:hypothetical protein